MDWNRIAAAAKAFVEEVKDAVQDQGPAGQPTTETVTAAAAEVADATRKGVAAVAAETRRGVAEIADEVQQGAGRFAQTVTRALEAIAESARLAGGQTGNAVPPPDPYEERLLTDAEEKLARDVFGSTLPYGAIWLSNGVGLEARPYTIPRPGHAGSYVIHFGADGFDDATDSSVAILGMTADVAFVHEMTHVWQGHNRRNPFDYIVDSLYNQIRHGEAAYDYTLSDEATWSDFTAEQQAHIVHDWYSIGQPETDERFRFIRDNIRTGTP